MMFVMPLMKAISLIFQIYLIMLFIRILISWFPEYSEKKWVQFIAFYTDPYLNLFRKIIPPIGMIDISPIFAFLALGLIEQGVKYLVYLALR
ncbi:MAG: YggT family protein [Parachlamydiaceae bacterium]